MRRLFGFFMAAGMLFMTACEQHFADFEKTSFDDKDISGVWACTSESVYGTEANYTGEIIQLAIFDGYTLSFATTPKGANKEGIHEFKNGYIHACEYEDLEVYLTMDILLDDDNIYVEEPLTGAYIKTLAIERDGKKLIIKGLDDVINTGVESRTFEKVKGFKPAK